MRRQVVLSVGGYNSEMAEGEDYDLWLRLSQVTRLANLPEVLVLVRKHGANATMLQARRVDEYCICASQRELSRLLQEEVPEALARALYENRFETASALAHAVPRLERLCAALLADTRWSNRERQLIRMDACAKIGNLYYARADYGNALVWYARALSAAPTKWRVGVKRLVHALAHLMRAPIFAGFRRVWFAAGGHSLSSS